MAKEKINDSLEDKVVREKEVFIGQVAKTKGDRAIVELYEKNSKQKSGEILDALNTVKARRGYIVKVTWREINKTKDKLMLVLLPVCFIIAGIFFGYVMTEYFARRKAVPLEDVMMVSVGVWGVLGFFYTFKYWRDTYGRGDQPTIIDIIGK